MSNAAIPDNWAEFMNDRQKPGPGLYVTSLPIGNARDITLRALDLLAQADLVACEDQRVTGKLCAIYGLAPEFVSYHDHNAERQIPRLLNRLGEGAVVALVSDAGTPLVSDPGFRLVQRALEAGIDVTAVPGASAVLAALTVSGLPNDRFLFAGFPPAKAAARRRWIEQLADIEATVILYEAPHRIAASLADLAAVFAGRHCALARELTKKFEQVVRGTVADVAGFAQSGLTQKGEFVVVLEGAPQGPAPSDGQADQWLKQALKKAPLSEAVDAVALVTGLSRRPLYQRALELTGARPERNDPNG